MKKVRDQGASEGDQQLEKELGIKNKCHKVSSTTNSPIVEVTSQNWP